MAQMIHGFQISLCYLISHQTVDQFGSQRQLDTTKATSAINLPYVVFDPFLYMFFEIGFLQLLDKASWTIENLKVLDFVLAQQDLTKSVFHATQTSLDGGDGHIICNAGYRSHHMR
jgi:hypothetical protein